MRLKEMITIVDISENTPSEEKMTVRNKTPEVEAFLTEEGQQL